MRHPIPFIMEWLLLIPLIMYGAKAFIDYTANKEAAADTQGYTERTIDVQKDADVDVMKFQHELNIEDWNRTNEYNLPVNQMNRYLDAGISPAAAAQAVAGAGSLTSIPAGSSPGSVSGSSAVVNPAKIGDVLQGFKDIAGVMNDTRSTNAQSRLAEAEAYLAQTEAYRNQVLTPLQAKQIKSDVLERFSNIAHNDAAIAKFNAETDRINQLLPYERENLVQQTNQVVSQIAENYEAIRNLRKQRDVMDSEITRNEAVAEQANAGALQSAAETMTEYERARSLVYENNKKAITDLLVQHFHVNPDDDFWQQIIESGARGDEYGIAMVQSLAEYAQGVDSELIQHFPNYKRNLGIAGAIYGLDWLGHHHRQNSHEKMQGIKDIESILLPFMNGRSQVDPIGFRK